ncbi:DUF342 domain-containing protein [Desulfitobacterium sp. PCE1]|uniref:Putative polymerase with PALM domain, HD hydrolase domain and Zn ribbon n=2 Tax=Desulfitobacterium dehalogenans TaxID=36854 RepID=I4ACS6_DESDJ|nr:FapA family protein [Desulfitobacterium sp. PCE1]AFM01761.1 putative polymerase with PALM domain, HD hydrolase domain and Zn ribbon [Desulfitobacterium dehalogenans ATCC 51507]
MSDITDNYPSNVCPVFWKPEDNKFLIRVGDSVKFVVPFPQGGMLYHKGESQETAFKVDDGDILEFYPKFFQGELTWEIEVRDQGLSAVAKVSHLEPGFYALPETLPDSITLRLQDLLIWQDGKPQGIYWDQTKLQGDLLAQGIVYGVLPGVWQSISKVQGRGEVVIAQGKPPTLSVDARLIDLLESKKPEVKEEQRVDYFASKLKLVHEGQALARKIPGVPGVPGKNVRGQEIPPPRPKDFQFKLKKNVRLSEDGLEVLATAPGLPLRMDELTFGVEPAYVLNQDVDLAVGSIEFPGDVFISGDVHDGLHIFSGGKVEIRGSTSRAEIRAEKGLFIYRNALAGKLVVGARYVVRSKLLHDLQALHDDLLACLMITDDFVNSPHGRNLKAGQCLKLIIERRFPDLPKMANELEKFLLSTKDELIQQDLIISVRTAKHFLSGLGPLDPQALPLLGRVSQALEQIIGNITLDVPEKLECHVDYVQGALIECAGNFFCRKGTYNSIIQAAGDISIEGVCRGGRIISGGNVEIKELGGSGITATTVQFPGTKRLKVGYCYANVVIVVDKEIITIDEPYKSLEIYREHGRVEIERLKG